MKLSLRIGEERTVLGLDSPARLVELAIGWQHLSRRYLKRQPPTGYEFEAAIAAVEDEIMRVRHGVPSGLPVETAEETIREIAIAAGLSGSDDMVLAPEAVEQTFQRLVARAPGMPDDARFSGTLLILRELIHHFDFREIRIRKREGSNR